MKFSDLLIHGMNVITHKHNSINILCNNKQLYLILMKCSQYVEDFRV